jgi:hypothetical protein
LHQLFLPLGRSGGPAGVRAVRDRLRTCARTNVGADALIVAGDRGQSAPQVYEHNTSRGVGTVIPYRRKNGSSPKQAEATDEWDEYGIPFCRHCKSGGDFVRFSVADGRARLWFECSMPQRAGCDRIQSISCGKDYTRLLPLWRTMDAYAVMRETHGEYERIHNLERVRYLVGPDQLSIRPKRIGIGTQQLRSSAAVFLEWLRICLRQGWIGRKGRHASGRPIVRVGCSIALAVSDEPQVARVAAAARQARHVPSASRRRRTTIAPSST